MANAQIAKKQSAETALMKPSGVVEVVASRVRDMCTSGELVLPADYSPDNAMKAAWLVLQEATDKSGAPVLKACSTESIANALLDMVVQGLNPSKKQCYFVAYGRKLVLMRSYFGSMALVKRVMPEAEIWSGVVYEGDEFEYEIVRGRKRIVKHTQKLANVQADRIVAAYCVIEPTPDQDPHLEVMTFDQIVKAWKQGQGYKDKGTGAHQNFSDQMAQKVVIQRACKFVINSSGDSYLLEALRRSGEALSEAEVDAEAAEKANVELIDVQAQIIEADQDDREEPDSEGEPEPDREPGSDDDLEEQPTLVDDMPTQRRPNW